MQAVSLLAVLYLFQVAYIQLNAFVIVYVSFHRWVCERDVVKQSIWPNSHPNCRSNQWEKYQHPRPFKLTCLIVRASYCAYWFRKGNYYVTLNLFVLLYHIIHRFLSSCRAHIAPGSFLKIGIHGCLRPLRAQLYPKLSSHIWERGTCLTFYAKVNDRGWVTDCMTC